MNDKKIRMANSTQQDPIQLIMRWANTKLAVRNIYVNDFTHDWQDGCNLVQLVEVITGEENKYQWFKKPLTLFEKRKNISAVLSYLEHHKHLVLNYVKRDEIVWGEIIPTFNLLRLINTKLDNGNIPSLPPMHRMRKVRSSSYNYKLPSLEEDMITKINSQVELSHYTLGIILGNTNCIFGCFVGDNFEKNALTSNIQSVLCLEDDILKTLDECENLTESSNVVQISLLTRIMAGSLTDKEFAKFVNSIPFTIIENPITLKPEIPVIIDGKSENLSCSDLLSMIFKQIKHLAVEETDTNVNNVIIAVPSFIMNEQRAEIKKAANMAGFLKISVIDDPIGDIAVKINLNRQEMNDQVILALDIGSGKSSASLMKLHNSICNILLNSGIYLGGYDIDINLALKYSKTTKIPTDLLKACETTKIVLSEKIETTIAHPDINKKITRDEFDKINDKIYKNIIGLINNILSNTQVQKSEVKQVLLFGGSTRIPTLQKLIYDFFNGRAELFDVETNQIIFMKKEINYSIGINFGMETCRFGLLKNNEYDPSRLKHSLPSKLGFSSKDQTVGAISPYMLKNNDSVIVTQLQRLIGRRFNEINKKNFPFSIIEDIVSQKPMIRVINREISIIELVGMFFKHIQEICIDESECYVNQIVMVAPSSYKAKEKQDLQQAAESIGMQIVKFVTPKYNVSINKERVLIIDIGAGKTEMIVINRKNEYLDSDCDLSFGGIDFDRIIVEKIISLINEPLTRSMRRKILSAAETAKLELSINNETIINIPSIVNITFTRAEFEELISEFVERKISKMLQRFQSIQEIWLFGGSTKIPFIRQFISKYYNHAIELINGETGEKILIKNEKSTKVIEIDFGNAEIKYRVIDGETSIVLESSITCITAIPKITKKNIEPAKNLLMRLKKEIYEKIKEEIVYIKIKVPLIYDESHLEKIKEAATSTGFNLLSIDYHDYSTKVKEINQRRSKVPKNVIVVDLGAGTSCTTIFHLNRSEINKLDQQGTDIGGYDIDKLIFDHLVEEIKNETVVDPNESIILIQEIEDMANEIKLKLTDQIKYQVDLPDLISFEFTRKKFNNVCNELFLMMINQTIEYCKEYTVNQVILLGGISKIPGIRQLIINNIPNGIEIIDGFTNVVIDLDKKSDKLIEIDFNNSSIKYRVISDDVLTSDEIREVGVPRSGDIELMTRIFKKIKENNVEDANVFVPFIYDDRKRRMIKEAGKNAGLNVLNVLDERIDCKKEAIVVSLGAGTSTYLFRDENDQVIRKGIELGGMDIDECLAKELNISENEAEKIKVVLSEKREIKIEGKTITRAYFERICLNVFHQIIKPFDEILEENQPKQVILFGGVGKIPRIRQFLAERCNEIIDGGTKQKINIMKRSKHVIEIDLGSRNIKYRVENTDIKGVIKNDGIESILNMIKDLVDKQINEDLVNAIVSVPHIYSIDHRKRIQKACDCSNFNVLEIKNHHLEQKIKEINKGRETRYSIHIDIGASTSCVLLFDLNKDQVIKQEGIEIGGDNLDQILTNYLAVQTKSQVNSNLVAEKAKIELSSSLETNVKELNINLSRIKFEEISNETIQRIIEPISNIVQQKNDIENTFVMKQVILSGGCSKIPLIRQLISNLFPKDTEFIDGETNQIIQLARCSDLVLMIDVGCSLCRYGVGEKNKVKMDKVIEMNNEKREFFENKTESILNVFKQMKQLVSNETQENVTETILVLPRFFNSNLINQMKLISKSAGLNVIKAVPRKFIEPKNISGPLLSFSMGGGITSCDLYIKEEGKSLKYKSSCFELIGGFDLDSLIKTHLKTDENVSNIKEELSNQEETKFLTRREFEKVCSSVFDRITDPIRNLMENMKINRRMIKNVKLSGGCSSIPKVRNILRSFFYQGTNFFDENGNVINFQNKSEFLIRIDFGTSNCRAEAYENDRKLLVDTSIISKVAFTVNNKIISTIPPKTLFDENSIVVSQVKRLLGHRFNDTVLEANISKFLYKVYGNPRTKKPILKIPYHGKERSLMPEEVTSYCLEYIKDIIQDKIKGDISSCQIVIPPFYTKEQRESIKESAHFAGFHRIELVEENYHEIAHKLNKEGKRPIHIIGIDIGGGETSVQLLKLDIELKMIESSGNQCLGGVDFDFKLAEYLATCFQEETQLDPHESVLALRKLRSAAEEAKINLSSSNEAMISIPSVYKKHPFKKKISRDDFNEICFDLFDSLLDPVKEILANFDIKEINQVVVNGKAAQITRIIEIISDFFGPHVEVYDMNKNQFVHYVDNFPKPSLREVISEPVVPTLICKKPREKVYKQLPKSNLVVGIDLGTANTRFSIFINDDTKYTHKIFSCVGFSDKENFIGEDPAPLYDQQSIDLIVGIKRVICNDIESLPFELKRDKNRTFIKSNSMTPEQLIATYLGRVKTRLNEDFSKEDVVDAVITVPAFFSHAQRQATKDAGRIAGFNVIRIMNETSAVSLGITAAQNQKYIFIYDMGGGTTKAALMLINRNSSTTIRTAGDAHLGGISFDLALAERLAHDFQPEIKNDRFAMRRLVAACEHAKIKLSKAVEATAHVDNLFDGKTLDKLVTRTFFDEVSDCLYSKALDSIKEIFMNCKITKNQVEQLFIVGGSTEIPALRQRIISYFNESTEIVFLSETATCRGAAMLGAKISGNTSEKLANLELHEVSNASIGVSLADGSTSVLIQRGTPLPTKLVAPATTVHNNQKNVGFDIIEGDKVCAADNNALGHITVEGIELAKKGVPKILVTMEINDDGILTVCAKDQKTKAAMTAKIENTGNLPEDEIQRMMKEAERIRRHDEETRKATKSKKVLEIFLERAEAALNDEENKHLLNQKLSSDYQQILADSKQWLVNHQNRDKEVYKRYFDRLRHKLEKIINFE